MRFTLSKQERLSSLKEIEQLFAEGKSLTKYPLRLIWKAVASTESVPVKVMFSVSKKKFSKAVDRNRVKRLLRENYRLQKPALYELLSATQPIHLGIMFTGNEMPDHKSIQFNLSQALQRLVNHVRSN